MKTILLMILLLIPTFSFANRPAGSSRQSMPTKDFEGVYYLTSVGDPVSQDGSIVVQAVIERRDGAKVEFWNDLEKSKGLKDLQSFAVVVTMAKVKTEAGDVPIVCIEIYGAPKDLNAAMEPYVHSFILNYGNWGALKPPKQKKVSEAKRQPWWMRIECLMMMRETALV